MPLSSWSGRQEGLNRMANSVAVALVGSARKSVAMITTRWGAAQCLQLSLCPVGAQEYVFYKFERTCHGIINQTINGAC
jgi:hypothetical protein